MKVDFYPLKKVPLNMMKYAVIMARYKSKWIFVQHKERKSWEIPGGTVEKDESVFECAGRELMEETGSLKFALFPVSIYSVTREADESYGMLFFAYVLELGELPQDSEIVKQELYLELPERLTYPEIQPHLYYRTLEYLREREI